MVSAQRRTRPQPQPRGPSGFTVFMVFLLLAVLCISGGFALGRYLLSTLGDTVADGLGPGADQAAGTGGQSGEEGTSGDDGTGGAGSVPAGGGPGSAVCDLSPVTFYAIQVGAFGSRANGDNVVADLAGKGLPGHVLEPGADSELYRVRTVTGTRREVVEAVLARVRTKGYADAFIVTQTVAASDLTLSGSSVRYVERAAAAVEALVSLLRVEGDIWDDHHAGSLDRAEASRTVDALIVTVREAKENLAGLTAPTDLAGLGGALETLLIEATANLQALKSYLASGVEVDRLAAESSFVGLVDRYVRFEAELESGS